MSDLSVEDHKQLSAFLEYVENACASDDRYGECTRHELDGGTRFASRFAVSDTAWLEASIDVAEKLIRVGFLCADADMLADFDEEISEASGSIESMVAYGASEAGLDPEDVAVSRCELDGVGCYSTTIKMDDLDDLSLDSLGLCARAVRLLETYFIAFGSFVAPESLDDDDDDYDDEELE